MSKKVVISASLIIFSLIIASAFLTKYTIYNLDANPYLRNSYVLDYGIYDSEEQETLIEEFKLYDSYEDQGRLYLVVGDAEEVSLLSYEEVFMGNVGLIIGGSNSLVEVFREESKSVIVNPFRSKVSFTIENKDYTFNLKDGEKSYFIIFQNESKEVRL